MPTDPYVPINCDYYDRLTVHAMRRQPVTVVYRTEDGAEAQIEDVIEDIYTKGPEEFLRLGSGFVLRLDRLITVDGVPLPPVC